MPPTKGTTAAPAQAGAGTTVGNAMPTDFGLGAELTSREITDIIRQIRETTTYKGYLSKKGLGLTSEEAAARAAYKEAADIIDKRALEQL